MENSTVTYILLLVFRVAVWCFKIQKQTLAPGNPNSNYGMYVYIHVINMQEGTQAFDILVFQRIKSPSNGAGSKIGCQEKRHTQPRVCVKFLLTF